MYIEKTPIKGIKIGFVPYNKIKDSPKNIKSDSFILFFENEIFTQKYSHKLDAKNAKTSPITPIA
jgi:hypothetical protein